MPQLFLLISNLLIIASYVLYAADILQRRAKPHRTTRFVIFAIVLIAFLSLSAQKSPVTIWLFGMSLFGAFAILLLSLKYGMGGWAKLDIASIIIAASGIIVWKLTNNPTLALYAAMVADMAGMVPTLVKTYRYPRTESGRFFLFSSFASGLNLLAQPAWKIYEVIYPLYLFFINLTVVVLIKRGGSFLKFQRPGIPGAKVK